MPSAIVSQARMKAQLHLMQHLGERARVYSRFPVNSSLGGLFNWLRNSLRNVVEAGQSNLLTSV
jgi:hypothetical protein